MNPPSYIYKDPVKCFDSSKSFPFLCANYATLISHERVCMLAWTKCTQDRPPLRDCRMVLSKLQIRGESYPFVGERLCNSKVFFHEWAFTFTHICGSSVVQSSWTKLGFNSLHRRKSSTGMITRPERVVFFLAGNLFFFNYKTTNSANNNRSVNLHYCSSLLGSFCPALSHS